MGVEEKFSERSDDTGGTDGTEEPVAPVEIHDNEFSYEEMMQMYAQGEFNILMAELRQVKKGRLKVEL